MKTYNTPAQLIRAVRKKMGMTQEKFANQFKTRRVNIALYETGRSNIPGDALLRIINFAVKKGLI